MTDCLTLRGETFFCLIDLIADWLVFFGSSCSISEELFEPQVATPISGDFRGGLAFNTS